MGNNIKNNHGIVEIYRKLEAELAGINPGCESCGSCCHFNTYDHVLYAATIETDYILNNVNVPRFDPDQNACPFLADNKCTIREHRTLGCRVFFCNPEYKEKSQTIYDKYYRMIKDLAEKDGVEWQYAPMMKLLQDKSI